MAGVFVCPYSRPTVDPHSTESSKGPKMAGTFELFQDKAGKFRFRLKASNGQIVAASQSYESKASALNGIESVKNSAPGAPTVEVADEE